MAVEPFVAAAVQPRYEPDPIRNLERLRRLIRRAAAAAARLVVLPECASGAGYIFRDAGDARSRAEPVPGPFSDFLAAQARELRLYLVAGLAERDGDRVYNTALLVDPRGGIVGRYRKNLLVSFDRRWFDVWDGGDASLPVWETELGRIGLMICGDARLPEHARCLALRGADIVCYPTLWGAPEQYRYNVPARAIENRLWLIASDKVGCEAGMDYPGGSFIIAPDGTVAARAGETEETVVTATVDPAAARTKALADGTDVLRARRPDAYGLLVRPVRETRVAALLDDPVVPGSMSLLGACIELGVDDAAVRPPAGSLLARALELVEQAARLCARVVLLPDLGSLLPPEAAEPVPGPTTTRMGAAARRAGVYLAYALREQAGERRYATTVLHAPSGEIAATYRAVHVPAHAPDGLAAGDRFVVCETDVGRMGLLGGLDGCFFEAARAVALEGADLVLLPAAFRDPLESDPLAVVRAVENRCFVMAASARPAAPSRRGGLQGGSVIADPRGTVLARAQRPDQIVKAQLDLVLSRCKEVLPRTDLLRDRRPEIYGPIAAPVPSPQRGEEVA